MYISSSFIIGVCIIWAIWSAARQWDEENRAARRAVERLQYDTQPTELEKALDVEIARERRAARRAALPADILKLAWSKIDTIGATVIWGGLFVAWYLS